MQGLTRRFLLDQDRQTVEELAPLFNIAPTEPAPVVIEEDHHRRLARMTFGLVPAWAKDVKIASQCINARAETVAEKPAYRDSLRKRRCLVVTDGYYEWEAQGKKKIPYRLTMKDGALFALAGVWDEWKGPDGRWLRSFSIITTDGNELTRRFHERMPVILRPDDESLWIAPYVTEPKTVLPLLKPYDPDAMTFTRVSTQVNKATNKGAEVLTPDPDPGPDLVS
jgi:putative SOS response-associated peptidase YedK